VLQLSRYWRLERCCCPALAYAGGDGDVYRCADAHRYSYAVAYHALTYEAAIDQTSAYGDSAADCGTGADQTSAHGDSAADRKADTDPTITHGDSVTDCNTGVDQTSAYDDSAADRGTGADQAITYRDSVTDQTSAYGDAIAASTAIHCALSGNTISGHIVALGMEVAFCCDAQGSSRICQERLGVGPVSLKDRLVVRKR
jgi:hypothetical protein